MMPPTDLIWRAVENLMFVVGFALLFYAVYVLGKYGVFDKHVRLSQMFPQLDSVEPESTEDREHRRLARLLAEVLD